MAVENEINQEQFRSLLLKRREELLGVAAAGRDAAGTVELDQSRVGRLSRMDALQSQAMSQETNRRRQLELSRITSALARIDAGEFGYCIDCDEPVAGNRLEADPTVLRCIKCATRSEQ